MGAIGALNQPFVSEAYDRLIEERARVAEERREEREQAAIDTGDKLRAARATLGLTQAALAKRLGLDGPALSLMETGTKPVHPQTDLAMRYLLSEPRQ